MSATALTRQRRTADLHRLADGLEVDVLVVGGGITGVGVALDAVTRGLSVALVERCDLANGTSRWSSKLAHGGLRYLTRGEVGIAWESARERALLVDRIAPHLVRALPILLPLTDDVSRPLGLVFETGIRLGDGLRAAARTSRRRLPAARRISAEEARRWAPGLRGDHLRGAVLHWDGQLEDDARLVVTLARTAAAHGARVVPYAAALALRDDGATIRDELTGEHLDVRARHVVNATGVWADRLAGGISLRPSRGSHLLVPAARLGDPRAAFNVPVPGTFGRFVFAVPRADGLVMVGLTDEPHDGPVPDAPAVSPGEERHLLETLSRALDTPLDGGDVVGRFAGLRPLLAADGDETAGLARDHIIAEDRDTGVVSVVGGKLTTYRHMAEDAVDRIAARPGVAAGPCRTAALPAVGAPGATDDERRALPGRLVRRFGAEASAVAALADGRPELLRPVAPGVPVLGVELLFAVAAEGALTVDDVVHRRTRAGFVAEWEEAVRAAAERLVPELTGAVA